MATDPHVERLLAEMDRLVSVSAPSSEVERFTELVGMFLANIPDYVLLLAVDGTILFFNRPRTPQMIAEVVGRNWVDYFPNGDTDGTRAAVERVVATGETLSLESTARYADGSLHELLARISPVMNEDRVIALALIVSDVTERKRVEAALRDSEEKLRLTIAATGMGLWSWDIESNVIGWDDAMCRMWGVTPETVPASYEQYIALIHPEDRQRLTDVIANVLRTGKYPDLEHRILRPDGTVRRIMAKATVICAADGTPERIVGGVLDVTEQRELEERSRQSQKLEAIGQLSAGVAHNFNNMLTIMLPNIELAQRSATSEAAPLLRSAHDAGLRAADLVRQLMTFAGGARAREKRADDVGFLVERTVAICRRAFDHAIDLSFQGSAHAQPVLADSTQLEQVLLNLLLNARDAVNDSPLGAKRVRVEVERLDSGSSIPGLSPEQAYVCIRVIDNGIGMSTATHSRIYEPFFTTKEVGRGTGLGLSTARTIVHEHGGVLDSITTLGAGTTFSVYLPLARKLDAAVAAADASAEPRGAQTLLIVDDEASVREVACTTLREAGYTVHAAADGRQALELLADSELRSSVALVLLDLSMPNMSGEAVRREIEQLAPHVKVAYFSGHAVESGDKVAGFIQKPVTRAQLLRGVRMILDGVVA